MLKACFRKAVGYICSQLEHWLVMCKTLTDQNASEKPLNAVWAAVIRVLSEYKPLIVIVSAYVLIAQTLYRPRPEVVGGNELQSDAVAALLVDRLAPGLFIIAALTILWGALPKMGIMEDRHKATFISPFTAITKDGGEPLIRLTIGLSLLAFLVVTFAGVKAQIPNLSPFHWDMALYRLDHALHVGVDPWRITWFLFGSDAATVIIDRLYFSWFLVIHVALFATMLFDQNTSRRRQYMLTYVLIWTVLGTFLAIVFSSAGPCYMADLQNGNTSYAPLMSQLDNVSSQYFLTSQFLQSQLWAAYTANLVTNYGISAMPSLHVAHAVLLILLARSHGKLLTNMAAGYAIIILIGSVHLGWHYAVDGYFAAIATLALWRASGWWVDRKGRA